MQRGIDRYEAEIRPAMRLWRTCNDAGPHPSRPATTPLLPTYVVHVRNTPTPHRGTWATYSTNARRDAMLSISKFAQHIGVDRGTVYRWESGKTTPTDPDVVQRFATVLGVDLDEALAAAGLRPGTTAPLAPTRERDAEEEYVRTHPKLSDEMKVRIIKLIRDRRERERDAGMEDTRRLVELMEREAG